MKYREEISGITQKRREAALEAAFRLFGERSIEEVNMTDIAREAEIGVASLYRYFGTKLALCVELGAKQWRAYAEEVDRAYQKRNGPAMNAREEFVFYLDSYIALYENHQPLLRFNANFDLFAIHENAGGEDLADYYDSVGWFAAKFHTVYEKALVDRTIRTDVSERELFFSVMYTMLPTMQKLAHGLIYPKDPESLRRNLLARQKEMFLAFVSAK